MRTRKDLAVLLLCGAVMAALSLAAWFKTQTPYSEAERRALDQFPALSVETLRDGSFMEEFESYTQDQFPLREQFRRLRAVTARGIFRQKDVNGLYLAQGHVSKLDYPLHENMISYAAERFTHIYETFLAGTEANAYLAVVPDKNYFLARQNGYPALDYDALLTQLGEETGERMQTIELFSLLSWEDYYRTDTHWRQECLRNVASELAAAMGASYSGEFTEVSLETPFYGVYSGQSALPLAPDTLTYLTNDTLEQARVKYLGDDGLWREGELYELASAQGRDPYDLFLSGTEALVTIENPLAQTDKELVIFRDSFASSLAPLLLEGYAKITLVDIRYIQSDFIGSFVQFNGQDVLFLYSTLLLNSSTALR